MISIEPGDEANIFCCLLYYEINLISGPSIILKVYYITIIMAIFSKFSVTRDMTIPSTCKLKSVGHYSIYGHSLW